jgi:multiphosphoryl transfer protein
VCGELAADPLAVPVLVGLGVDELSVNIPRIPDVKAQIRLLNFTAAQTMAVEALRCVTAEDVREIAAQMIA